VPAAKVPLRECHGDHAEPFHTLYQTALSVPVAKTYTELPDEVAAGAAVTFPPRDVAFDHAAPFHVIYQTALSLPRSKR
jgi:hypothetical protein